MSDPTLYGFLKEAEPWLIPLATFTFGRFTKGATNQVKLDKVCGDVGSIEAQVGNNTTTLAKHDAILETNVKAVEDIRYELKENNRLLGKLCAHAGVDDSQVFRASPR